MMNEEIVNIEISSELDIYLAQRFVMELGDRAGMNIGEQTRMATAVSEVARNMVEFAGEGKISYWITEKEGRTMLEARLVDTGPGIQKDDLLLISKGLTVPRKANRGIGLSNARRLIDSLEIESNKGGTQIKISNNLPVKALKPSPAIINEWKSFFKEKKPVSPYEEIKNRNTSLLHLTEELRKSNEELRIVRDKAVESTESFQFIANNTSQVILKTGPGMDVHFSNKYWSDYTGMQPNEALNTGWQQAVHPEDVQKMLNAWGQSMGNERFFECEVRLKRSDDVYLWHLFRAEAVHNTDLDIVMWVLTGFNTDEKTKFSKELEAEVHLRTSELINTNRELSRSNAELEQFAYVASHDLKEPIRMVSNFTALLAKRYHNNLDQQGNEFISFILEGAERMQTLIRELLKFSSIGRTSTEFEPVDMNQVMNVIKADLHEKIENTAAVIKYDDLPVIWGVESLVIRLFQNLIENAIKFKAEETPVISITVEDKTDKWLFVIADNGMGISKEYFSKIFILFQRLHEREQYSGSGMGLSICKKIVEFHGGNIWVTSEPGQGTAFHFTMQKQ